jgi:hypothetical protein
MTYTVIGDQQSAQSNANNVVITDTLLGGQRPSR